MEWAATIVVATVVVVIIANRRDAKLALDLLPILHRRGPSTISELMAALQLDGFFGRAKVTSAVASLLKQGKIIEHPIPANTPLREKINVRRYEATRDPRLRA